MYKIDRRGGVQKSYTRTECVYKDNKILEKILINRLKYKYQLSNDKNISSTVISIRGFFIFGLQNLEERLSGFHVLIKNEFLLIVICHQELNI